MKEALEVIATSPLPTILGIGGIVFLFLALVGKVGGKLIIDIPLERQKGFAIAGTALLLVGALLYIIPSVLAQPTPEPTPTPTPSFTPTPSVVVSETVAFMTFHGWYVTAMDDKDDATGEITDWKLRAKTSWIDNWEKFTLFCLDNGKVALRTYHGRYVTATDANGGWVLRADTNNRLAWEEFTLSDANTGEQWPCLQVFELLKRGEVRIALQTHHKKGHQNRYVTAPVYEDEKTGKIWDWIIRAETDVLSDWEKFTVIPQQ